MSSRSVNVKSGWYYNAETSGWGVLITQIGEHRYNVMLFYRNYQGRSVWLIGEHDLEESLKAKLMMMPDAPQLPGMVAGAAARAQGSIEITDVLSDDVLEVRIDLVGPAVSDPVAPIVSPPPPASHTWRGQITRLV